MPGKTIMMFYLHNFPKENKYAITIPLMILFMILFILTPLSSLSAGSFYEERTIIVKARIVYKNNPLEGALVGFSKVAFPTDLSSINYVKTNSSGDVFIKEKFYGLKNVYLCISIPPYNFTVDLEPDNIYALCRVLPLTNKTDVYNIGIIDLSLYGVYIINNFTLNIVNEYKEPVESTIEIFYENILLRRKHGFGNIVFYSIAPGKPIIVYEFVDNVGRSIKPKYTFAVLVNDNRYVIEDMDVMKEKTIVVDIADPVLLNYSINWIYDPQTHLIHFVAFANFTDGLNTRYLKFHGEIVYGETIRELKTSSYLIDNNIVYAEFRDTIPLVYIVKNTLNSSKVYVKIIALDPGGHELLLIKYCNLHNLTISFKAEKTKIISFDELLRKYLSTEKNYTTSSSPVSSYRVNTSQVPTKNIVANTLFENMKTIIFVVLIISSLIIEYLKRH